MDRNKRSEIALYLWDYYFISHVPAIGDEQPWAAIERAACRILESEPWLDPPAPAHERLRSARRVRNAVHHIVRQLDKLSTETEDWILESLAALGIAAQAVIDALADSADAVVH
jgi:hypothetical protein